MSILRNTSAHASHITKRIYKLHLLNNNNLVCRECMYKHVCVTCRMTPVGCRWSSLSAGDGGQTGGTCVDILSRTVPQTRVLQQHSIHPSITASKKHWSKQIHCIWRSKMTLAFQNNTKEHAHAALKVLGISVNKLLSVLAVLKNMKTKCFLKQKIFWEKVSFNRSNVVWFTNIFETSKHPFKGVIWCC